MTPRVTKHKAPLISDSEVEHTSEASIMEIDEPALKVVEGKAQGHRTTSSMNDSTWLVHLLIYISWYI